MENPVKLSSRRDLEQRLLELHCDVSKLNQKLQQPNLDRSYNIGIKNINRVKEINLTLPGARVHTAFTATAQATNKVTTTHTTRSAQNIQLQKRLKECVADRERIQFENEKLKRFIRTLQCKLQEASKYSEELKEIKAHCQTLEASIDLSEKVRLRQNKLIVTLQKQLEKLSNSMYDNITHTQEIKVDNHTNQSSRGIAVQIPSNGTTTEIDINASPPPEALVFNVADEFSSVTKASAKAWLQNGITKSRSEVADLKLMATNVNQTLKSRSTKSENVSIRNAKHLKKQPKKINIEHTSSQLIRSTNFQEKSFLAPTKSSQSRWEHTKQDHNRSFQRFPRKRQ